MNGIIKWAQWFAVIVFVVVVVEKVLSKWKIYVCNKFDPTLSINQELYNFDWYLIYQIYSVVKECFQNSL